MSEESKQTQTQGRGSSAMAIGRAGGLELVLRVIAFGATLSAAIVMGTDKQTVSLLGIELRAKFSYAPALTFFVVANAIACAYAVLSLLISLCEGRSVFIMFLFDLVIFLYSGYIVFASALSFAVMYGRGCLIVQVIAALVTAGASAATAIAYVGHKGNSHTGWMAICGTFGRFCDHIGGALVSSFIAVLIFLALTVLSAFSLYKHTH